MMKMRVKLAVNNPFWDAVLGSTMLRYLDQEIASDERLTVLEIGCGRGGTTEILLNLLPNSFITAVDIDDEQIRLAEHRIRSNRVEFMVEHAAETSFEDAMFDLVTEFNTLHHVLAWRKAIAEAARVLKPGGYFILAGINRRGLTNALFRKFVSPKSLINTVEIIEEAARQGLKIKKDYSHSHYMRLVFRRVPLRKKPKRIAF
ncbi:methyltransferase domain-containing protein [Patescibacteria group bacterium]|nr:methyltransferase domain-containing protein [Patescibacteria group bacterium]MBU1028963.1 methyltransferase domain-containing protein [Patescibacteria group bacterium]